jgi:hypothetical protein
MKEYMPMKKLIRSLLAVGTFCGALTLTRAEEAGYVDWGKLTPNGDSQFVEVNIKSNLIAMVASLAAKAEPEVTDFIMGLKHIRVNVLGLTKENRKEMTTRISDLREKLDKTGWERIVTAIEKNQDVGIFLKMKDAKAVEGLCVTVVEGNQVVLVNIIGDIRPEKLSTVGERFNIEPLKHIPSRPAKQKSADDDDSKPKAKS